MLSTARKFTSVLVILVALFVGSLMIFSKNVHAGWTCCKASNYPNQCGTATSECDGCSDNVETKNPGVCGPTCTSTQINAGTCRICPNGWVSNQCNPGGGTNPGLACSVRVTPSTFVNLTPTATKNVIAIMGWSPGFPWYTSGANIRATSIDTAIAKVAPASVRPALNTNVTFTATAGETPGQGTSFTFDGRLDTRAFTDNRGVATCNAAVSVNVVDYKQCLPGAKCDIVGGGAPAKGKKVACQIPVVPADQASGYNVRYDMQCDLVRGTTTTKNAVRYLNRTSNVFPQFTIGYASSSYKCSFRYCLINATDTVCSKWGTAQ